MALNSDFTKEEEKVNDAFNKFQIELNIGFDDFLDILAKQMMINASKETHPAVKGCFLGCAEHLRNASFAFYASTK